MTILNFDGSNAGAPRAARRHGLSPLPNVARPPRRQPVTPLTLAPPQQQPLTASVPAPVFKAALALAIAGALAAATALPAHAAGASLPAISAGARLAANCAACHGTDGMTEGAALPSLAGQARGALLVALKAFKSGARQGTIMPQIARGYTDEQLALLAEYFAAQPLVPNAALPAGPRLAGSAAVAREAAGLGRATLLPAAMQWSPLP